MNRYIDADRLEECMRIVQKANKDSVDFNKRCKATDVFLDIWGMIKEQPTADVVEVVHGEWQFNNLNGFKIYDCSNCGIHMEARWNYCPNCGADMRERRSHDN